MKLQGGLSRVNDLFNPREVRVAKRLQKQWDELDDVVNIIEGKNNAHKLQERVQQERDELIVEMNMLLDRIASDSKRVKQIVERLSAS